MTQETMADLNQFLQFGQHMQGRLQQLESELAGRVIEISAGAGMVRVTADGRGTVLHISIAPDAFEGRDAELLSDLVLGAVAEAQRRAAELMQAEMRSMPQLPLTP